MSIKVEQLSHIYSPGTPFESVALKNMNFEVKNGEFIGLIGHTGSGKSTLIQHLNGLLKATSGKIYIDGMDLTSADVTLTDIRKKVGLVFQYPEYQLFEETIEKDIAFGPSKLNLSAEEITKRVKEAMQMVGLNYEALKDKSPFELSGGQKRRVAIAGVLAMKPDILILDEPTAGLDPKGRDEILNQIRVVQQTYGTTIILVSHSMDDVSRLVNRLIVMNRGEVAFDGTPRQIFAHQKKMESIGLGVPKVVELSNRLREQGWEISEDILTLEEMKEAILKEWRKKQC
ncbi:energy-coupling factor transporter ATPase [Filifactor alocis]|uniref:energy-coupling factor transporter ATPase n=1 Tax=Filifactor alocis TaxID=143361 RepID=UPI0028E32E48|nr:energy-coupling factor transporter ATPase [Filifactor alocis]